MFIVILLHFYVPVYGRIGSATLRGRYGTYVGATVHCTVECRCKRVQNLGFSGDGS